MAEQDTRKGTVTTDVEVDTTVDDPAGQRDDTVAKERSTSPVPRVGDTWEDMSPDPEANGPQRRVGVLEISGDDVLVENKSTRVKSHVRIDRFVPPNWRFIG